MNFASLIIQSKGAKRAVLTAFRSSGCTTLCNLDHVFFYTVVLLKLNAGAGSERFGQQFENVCPIRLFKPLLPMASVPPWTTGVACGRRGQRCALPPDRPPAQPGCPPFHYLGARPPDPPRFATLRGLFEISPKPENRQGLGVGHGQPQAVAHPATGAPVPGTLRLGGRGSRGPVREGAPGAQPRGPGRAAPRQGAP